MLNSSAIQVNKMHGNSFCKLRSTTSRFDTINVFPLLFTFYGSIQEESEHTWSYSMFCQWTDCKLQCWSDAACKTASELDCNIGGIEISSGPDNNGMLGTSLALLPVVFDSNLLPCKIEHLAIPKSPHKIWHGRRDQLWSQYYSFKS